MPPKPTYQELENRIKKFEQTELKRKQAENAFKERGDFLNTLIDAVPIPIFYKDRNGLYLGFNKAFEVFFGKTRKELIGKSVFDINPKYLADIYHAKDTELFESQDGEQRYESQVYNANNELRDVVFNKSIYKDKKGSPIGLIGAVFDITERKALEDTLKQNEQRYKSAQRMGQVGNWEYDISTRNFWGSDEAKRIYGFDPESKNFTTDEVENCIPDRENVHQALMDLIENGKKYDLEFEIRPVTGPHKKIIKSMAEVVNNESGIPSKVIGVVQDITDRKHSEEGLKESEERFRHLAESSIVGVNIIQDGILTYANLKFADIFGYSVAECLDNMSYQHLVHPEDFETVRDNIRKRLSGDIESLHYTFRGVKKSGETIYIETFGSSIKFKGKAATFATIIDITERILIEREREKLISDLQKALTEIKQLSGLLPVCSHCKKVRDDKGYWNQIDAYIEEHSEADISHSICPECADKYYPDMDLYGD